MKIKTKKSSKECIHTEVLEAFGNNLKNISEEAKNFLLRDDVSEEVKDLVIDFETSHNVATNAEEALTNLVYELLPQVYGEQFIEFSDYDTGGYLTAQTLAEHFDAGFPVELTDYEILFDATYNTPLIKVKLHYPDFEFWFIGCHTERDIVVNSDIDAIYTFSIEPDGTIKLQSYKHRVALDDLHEEGVFEDLADSDSLYDELSPQAKEFLKLNPRFRGTIQEFELGEDTSLDALSATPPSQGLTKSEYLLELAHNFPESFDFNHSPHTGDYSDWTVRDITDVKIIKAKYFILPNQELGLELTIEVSGEYTEYSDWQPDTRWVQGCYACETTKYFTDYGAVVINVTGFVDRGLEEIYTDEKEYT